MGLLGDIASGAVDAAKAAPGAVRKYAENMGAPTGNLNTALGEASKYDNSTYNVNSHSYPSDLMSNSGVYGGNYVIFYINVQESSKLVPKGSGADYSKFVDSGKYSRITSDMVANKQNMEQLMTGQGLITGGKIALGGAIGGTAGAVATGAEVLGIGAIASLATTASRQTRRLKTAIALHVPNQLSIRYGMQYDESDTAMLQAATTASADLAQALSKGVPKSGAEAKENFGGLGSIAKGFLGSEALQKNAGLSAATGLAGNPKKEQVFKGVDFRKFSFDYQFFPRDEKEAENVLRIIEEFKFHMHPEFLDNTSNFVYVYPSEFDVLYYKDGVENRTLHRHTACVLEEMNVNYTPNGAFTTFANGMPTQINVTMQFRELALLTKDRVKDGM
jgi:hypothetical protein